ncbi:hypothetical protein [Sphingobium fluviale]|uniref:Uncharacterized protein n=1 Tax=Sphingobium fluviale TaxID=2506423 RepID=A0A4Q1KEQ2_9SPHN|nr:hypothetical protein [Sphingobium fluviale]RXR25205.1 hypothetical protein EQG66_14455 [Sphingobium fluviale]
MADGTMIEGTLQHFLAMQSMVGQLHGSSELVVAGADACALESNVSACTGCDCVIKSDDDIAKATS